MEERSWILLKMADCIEGDLTLLAFAEAWNTGKVIRGTLNIDMRLQQTAFATSQGLLALRIVIKFAVVNIIPSIVGLGGLPIFSSKIL